MMGFFSRKEDPIKKAIKERKRKLYNEELVKQRAIMRKQQLENEVSMIKAMAKRDAQRELNRPSKLERLAKIGENMQQASDDYSKFFGPQKQLKRVTKIPEWV